MRRLLVAAMSCCLSVLVLAGPVAASSPTLVDCHGGANLQAAIDAASPGDTLRVKGTCTGNFVISKDLALVGTGAHPTLDGGGSGTVVDVPVGPGGITTTGATVRITGLTIRGGDLGIHDRGTMTLSDSRVRGNDEGIYVELELSVPGGLTLRHSRVEHNGGNGIRNFSQALLVRHSIVSHNGGSGIVNDQQKSAVIRSSTVSWNTGAGISNGGGLSVYDSVIRGNHGGGVNSGAHVIMRASVVVGNSSPGNGGGLSLTGPGGPGGQGDIAGSVIKDNHAVDNGGGIYVAGDGRNLRMDDVRVTRNTAGGDGGGIFEAGPGFTSLTHVTYSNNSPNDCTGC